MQTSVPARRVLDDGRVAITFEPRGGTIRALPGLPSGEHPAYIAVGEVTHLADGIVKLHAFAGQLSRRHMRLIVQLLVEQEYRVAYVDRAAGRVMPMAEQIEQGDWKGWWRIDLISTIERRACMTIMPRESAGAGADGSVGGRLSDTCAP